MSSVPTADNVTETEPTQLPTKRYLGALAAIFNTLLILGVGFVLCAFTGGMFVALYVGFIAAYVAIPYTVVAITARELSARRWRRRAARNDGEPEQTHVAVRFGMFRQRASMTTAIVMLAALVAVAVWGLRWDEILSSGFSSASAEGFSMMAFGAFAVVAALLAIVVNVPSIYSASVVGSERYAVRERVGAWKLIIANTILTTASWIGYCVFAIYYLAVQI
ncbi:hypothetical protein [Orlajensenia leifsoniae]|uniref:Uncharacterized protein n=1 Tax=Orlajensenia leifsoniae TaxID=2561933 RepID=A0A4Y9R6L8_9MICO|nr:hypothetical protein [Leifsonia flava]TFW00190.1 hypothetical protein E4M00_03110 [Leifsonia flava]